MEQSKKLTKEERIAMRAARVQAKRNKEDPRSGPNGKDAASDVGDASRQLASKLRVGASRQTVESSLLAGQESLSDVFVDREHSESVRRRKEAALRQERFERVERELDQARRVNAELEAKWEEVAQHHLPQELYEAISRQYKQASALLAGKDELIQFLQVQLRQGDEEYVELLSQHQEDVNQALQRMSDHFARFLATVRGELRGVEEAFVKERAELLEKNREEIEALFEKRRKMELVMMESRQARERKFASELLEIRARDAEDYTSLKVDLESSIQLFEQQLEEMRATYQLNAEKLEYNHAVLVERDLENKATVEHHRQRIRRLKLALSTLISRFNETDKKFKAENAFQTEEYKRATEAFKDLQKKYAHFVQVDTRRYGEVWEMNEAHVMQLVHKLLRADQIIHEQILGVEWKPPILPADRQAVTRGGGGAGGGGGEVDVEAISSTQIFAAGQHAAAQAATYAAQQAQQAQLAASAAADTMAVASPNHSPTSFASPSKSPAPSPSPSPSSLVSPSPSPSSAVAVAAPSGSRFTPAQIKCVLDLLGKEVAFLLDSRVQEAVAGVVGERNGGGGGDGGEDEDAEEEDADPSTVPRRSTPSAADREAEMYQADGLMAALGVEDREDLDSLVALFFEGPPSDAQGGAPAAAGGAGGSSQLQEKPSVHPNDVAKVIKEFVLQRQQVKTKGTTSAGAGAGAGGAGATAASAAAASGVGGGSILQALLAAAGATSSSSSSGSKGVGPSSGSSSSSVLSEKKARRKERERLFWHYLGNHVVSSHTLGVWGALERWQAQYNALLEERATLIDETTELARQNEELKMLLQQYLASSVNQELQIPPTRLIRVNQSHTHTQQQQLR